MIIQSLRCRIGLSAAAFCFAILVVIVSLMFASSAQAATTETVLHNFSGPDGENPEFSLLRDTAGNLYGVTAIGGANGLGTVFEISPSGSQQVLYSFKGGTDGKQPSGRLVMDGAGNLYGVTSSGGLAKSYGTAFRLHPNSNGTWTETVLFKFTFAGSNPSGGLTLDTAGNIYGTTRASGLPCKCGVAFKLSPNAKVVWKSTILHHFLGGANDGAYPNGDLVFDTAGNLYGTTSGGYGTAFELSPNGSGGWTEKVIQTFGTSGFPPVTGLIIDQTDNLYGTTWQGGSYAGPCAAGGCGSVFELSPGSSGWTEKVLYSFLGGNDGSNPAGVLALHAGNLYGTTLSGGTHSDGVVFQLSPSGSAWTEQLLHTFSDSPDGAFPFGGVTLDSAGNIYGPTENGGTGNKQGTVYEISQ